MLAGIFPGAAGPAPTRGARERVSAYADMPWLHAVSDKVASAFAQVEWQLKAVRGGQPGPDGDRRAVRVKGLQRGDRRTRVARYAALRDAGDLVDIADHPMLDLLRDGNPFHTGLEMRKLTQLHLYIEGDAFWLKERNGLGVPAAAYPVPPHWMAWTPTPSRQTFRIAYRGFNVEVPETEVLWFSDRNPENPYARGAGKARVVADELEADEYAAKHIRQVFVNQNRPDFIVSPKEGDAWSDAERLRFEQQWRANHEGFWRSFRAMFAARKVDVFEFKQENFRQLQMADLRRHARDVVVQVAGMPPELLGIIENSNRSTIDAAEFLFSRWVLAARLEAFRAVLQERLVPEFDERLVVDYADTEDDDREQTRAMAGLVPWSRTVDEWRAAQGLEPLDAGAGEVHARPVGVDFGPLEAREPAAPVLPPGAIAIPDDEDEDDEDDEDEDDEDVDEDDEDVDEDDDEKALGVRLRGARLDELRAIRRLLTSGRR